MNTPPKENKKMQLAILIFLAMFITIGLIVKFIVIPYYKNQRDEKDMDQYKIKFEYKRDSLNVDRK